MPTFSPETEKRFRTLDDDDLRFLQPRQVAMIDEALASLGQFGEVHLRVERGRLRYIVTQTSFDAIKWQPGSLYEKP